MDDRAWHPMGERTLGDLLEERVAETPERSFLVFEDADGAVSEITYTELHDRVLRCARGFADVGVERGECVVVHLRNCPQIVITLFALARLGAIFVPSNTASAAPELCHVLDVTRARLLVTEPRFQDVVRDARDGSQEVFFARGQVAGERDFAEIELATGEPPASAGNALDVVELVFTSGTTSKPKGVMLTHANCLRSGQDAVHSLWLQEEERCITALPLFHVNAQAMSLFAAMTVGGTLVLLEEFRASRFWGQVRAHGATQTAIVAMQVRVLLAQPPAPTDRDHRLRRTFYAINIPTEEKEGFEERFGVDLINGYGLSEAMTLAAVSPVIGPRRWPSVGLPSPGRVIRLLDEDGRDVPPGEVGEIAIEGVPGRSLMLGYYRDEAATREALRDGRLHTGDNAYADEDGYLYFFDRKKDVIKRAGENVSAMEVEAVILEHPDVADVAVVGVPDDIRDEAVVALVVATPAAQIDPAELTDFCAARLARFKVPTRIVQRDALPKTSIGKVRKSELRDELADAISIEQV